MFTLIAEVVQTDFTSYGVLAVNIVIVIAFLKYLQSRDSLNREAAKEGHEAAMALRNETEALRKAIEVMTGAIERMKS